jgi:nitroreductase
MKLKMFSIKSSMEFQDVICNRHSVRSFLSTPIPQPTIDEILLSANRAPSAGNLQARDFIIVKDQTIKEHLCVAALNQQFLKEAPVVIVVCANLKRIASYGTRGKELYCIQDASAAVEHILLSVVDNDLDACWVGAFDELAIGHILQVPSYIRPIALIPIGFSKNTTPPTTRRDIKELVHLNHW